MKVGKRKAKTEEVAEELDVGEELISTEKLRWKQEQLTNMRKEKQIEYENLQESLRELDHMSMDYREVDRKREALMLAISRLDMLTLEMQKQMEQVLNRKASAVIEKLTDGRYSRLVINDSLHMHVWHENQQIAVEQLSQGTLEQIYFALQDGSSRSFCMQKIIRLFWTIPLHIMMIPDWNGQWRGLQNREDRCFYLPVITEKENC